VPAPVPLQTMPWARPRSSIPWMRLVVGLMLLVVLGYVFIKWGLPFISEKVMIFFTRFALIKPCCMIDRQELIPRRKYATPGVNSSG
jgi:hypothetical protein